MDRPVLGVEPAGLAGMNAAGKRMANVKESARWALFAVAADDRRRMQYERWLTRVRRGEVGRRRRAATTLPSPLSPVDHAEGFRVGAVASPQLVADVVREVRDLACDVPGAEARTDHDKPYLLDLTIDRLPGHGALARLALDESVISTAAEYLGGVPLLAGVTVLRSPFVPGPPSGSQLFHSDWEDVVQLKLFVYCSDVGVRDGPLTAVSAAASARAKRTIGYRYGGAGFRRRDEEILPLVGAEAVTVFEGPTGTCVFIDTSSCFHYGSRIADDGTERLVVQFQYLRPIAFDLLFRTRPLPVVDPPPERGDWRRLVVPGEPGPP